MRRLTHRVQNGAERLPQTIQENAINNTNIITPARGVRGRFEASLRRQRPYQIFLVALVMCLLVFGTISSLGSHVWDWWIRAHPRWLFRRDDKTTAVVFYHIYIPPHKGKRGIQQALEIVEEQLTQIATLQPPAAVYYVTTGVDQVARHQAQATCRQLGLTCQWMGHWSEGQETLSLTRLYDFCQTHPSASVVYLHTKGSFHSNHGKNHVWRRSLTQAALTCLGEAGSAPAKSDTTCNVCGLQFYPVWTTFFPGNMWSASCSYVQTLWEPVVFGEKLAAVVARAQTLATEGSVTNHTSRRNRHSHKSHPSCLGFGSLYNTSNPGNLGLGRYAAEHWIASHPYVRPCEVEAPTPQISLWDNASAMEVESFASNAQRMHLTTAPQHGWTTPGRFRWDPPAVQALLLENPPTAARCDYFLLPGFLHRWQSLYDKVPPRSSWVWRWYPDALYWQNEFYEDTTEEHLPAPS